MTFIKSVFTLLILSIITASDISAQTTPAPRARPAHTSPRVARYVGILHPLVTFGSDGTHTNFDESYTVGMPTGINLWKTAKVGFSVEFVPFIRAENGTSKMSNF